MNTIDYRYQALLQDILDNGEKKQTRNGEVLSVFGRQIRHKMSDGFPLLTTKKMAWKQIVTELLWFLRGDTNIKFLVDNDCHIWDGDCFANYYRNFEKHLNTLPEGSETEFIINKDKFINKIKTDGEFAKKWGDLGSIYGKQWRNWKFTDKFTNGQQIAYVNGKIDQIAKLINELKTNPDSRRLMVSAWNVGELDSMALPPCHYGFQVYTRKLSTHERMKLYDKLPYTKDIFPTDTNGWNNLFDGYNIPTRTISLMWNQRSVDTPLVDTPLGLPFNIASYGLLLEIIAKMVNMVPDELIGNLGDCHIYSNQIDGVKEQIGRELTVDERVDIASKDPKFDPFDFGIGIKASDESVHKICDLYEVPRRTREPYPLPKLNINTEFWPTESGECGVGPLATNLTELEISDFTLENYQSHPKIVMPLSN